MNKLTQKILAYIGFGCQSDRTGFFMTGEVQINNQTKELTW